MNIEDYKKLIINLPVREQCFTTKRSTWIKAEENNLWLKNINDLLFGNNESLTISRQDILDTKNSRELIIKTIYWGYSNGMRGRNFVNIIEGIEKIEAILNKLKRIENPTKTDFDNFKNSFKNISGIALSTYSKLLYFLNVKINNIQCLILDQRIINVLASSKFSDFQQFNDIKYENAEKKYIDYLTKIKSLACKMNTKEENIELFLFAFANNLKK